jgi:hypothetical protein
VKIWEECWENVPQIEIQRWIQRIIFHIQKIIKLEGGNEFKEGKTAHKGKYPGIWKTMEDEIVLTEPRRKRALVAAGRTSQTNV